MPFIVILVFYSRKERSKMMLPAFFFSTFLYKVDDKLVVSTTNIWIPLLEWWWYWLWWWFCNIKWFLCTSLFYISHKNQNHQQKLFYKWDNWVQGGYVMHSYTANSLYHETLRPSSINSLFSPSKTNSNLYLSNT